MPIKLLLSEQSNNTNKNWANPQLVNCYILPRPKEIKNQHTQKTAQPPEKMQFLCIFHGGKLSETQRE